ncbi:MAG: c-type cytochrome biogenesis protein CcmI [Beijerinckiaceae bacterium]
MIFWLVIAAMTLVALAFVAWPFVFHAQGARSGGDVAVYRDQLDEIERDRNAGLIDDSESEAARIEVSRRLLKAAETEASRPAGPPPAESRAGRRAALIAAIVVIPSLSAALYYRLGSPGDAQPKPVAVAEPGRPDAKSIADMIAKVENHLQRDPDDAKSWQVLAPVYQRLERYDDAVNAWRNIIRLNGENADNLESLGESMVAAADGVVTAEAAMAFDRALAMDKEAIAARYYKGLAAVQDGRNDDARRIWSELLASAPADASWAASVRGSLARLEGQPDTAPGAGPSARQMQDAAGLPQGQQAEMIRGMVDKLAARLKANGDDPEGWAQLVRSWSVLGDEAQARQAVEDARKALAGSPLKSELFEDELKRMSDAPPPKVSAAPSGQAAAPPHADGDAIRGMVQRLADRLKLKGDDPEGWAQLVRSYRVLGDAAQANQAMADARNALAATPDKLRQFDSYVEAGASR